MLLDLKSLNVDICHRQSSDKGDRYETSGVLGGQGATKSMSRDHQHPRCSEQGEDNHKVSVEPVEKHHLVANSGDELEDDEK